MAKVTSFLKSLRFNPQLKNSLVAKYLANPRLFILLLVALISFGVYSFISLPRQLNPEINIPIVNIITTLPGASPEDVESLVTIPIEDSISGVDDLTRYSSSSQDSVSLITLEFAANVDADKARSDVQSAVETVTDLPEDSSTPRIQKLDFENTPVWTFVLSGTSDSASTSRYARLLKEQIEESSKIKDVQLAGLEEQEIQIILDPVLIQTYGINTQSIIQSIRSNITSFPAGNVVTDQNTFSLTIDPEISSIDDIRNLVLNLNGQTIKLGEVARVQEKVKPDQSEALIATSDSPPVPAVTFNVFKTDNADITEAQDEAEEIVNVELEKRPQFSIVTVVDTAEEIDHQFGELLRDFWIIVSLIFIVLFIFLGLRQAIVASLSVPFTFLISFIVMELSGISLNFLSLFSLLLSLGLLVDDTIVVVSAMTSYFRTGKFTPYQTALLVWRDFIVAILTTTITTVFAFLPLLLATGIIGEFIKSIPIVVSATLIASFFVAMFITLPLLIILLKPQFPRRIVIFTRILVVLVLLAIFVAIVPKGPILIIELLALGLFLFVTATVRLALVKKARAEYKDLTSRNKHIKKLPSYLKDGVISFERISNRYKRVVHKILSSSTNRKRALAMVIIFSIFSYLLLPFGLVKNEFFPNSDIDYLYVTLELPPGTNRAKSEEESRPLVTKLQNTPGLEFLTVTIGQSVSQDTGGAGGDEANNVLFTLKLTENGNRPSSIEIAEDLRQEFAGYGKGKLSVVEISGGPPAGADIQIKLFGDDLTTLGSLADRLETYLEGQPEAANIDRSITSGTSKIVFKPDNERLAAQGVTIDQVGGLLRVFASGISPESITLPSDSEEKDITIRSVDSLQRIESLGNILVPTSNSATVPLSSLGTFNLTTNPTQISREDGRRTLSVVATVREGYNIPEVNAKLEAFATNELSLPEGYSWQTGGVNEENQESVSSILSAMLLSFILILTTMVLQFSSFRKALIVMLVIPLSISGVFILFALTQTPLSFPALIGVLALFGIVVKNSILVVDKISQNAAIGMRFEDAIADGSASRLEAIALTSVTAIIGLIPVTLSDPLWRGLGGAIIAGLFFSGTIMLFFIPVVYYYWFRPHKKSTA